MRPIRKIISERLRYKFVSITQDETRLCVRVLLPVINKHPNVSGDDVLTTKSLYGKVFQSEQDFFQVIAEGIFDLDQHVHKYWWTPGSNIMFYVTPRSISQGIVEVCQKGGLTIGTKENSAELGHRLGQTTICQIWCRNCNDKITETAKSICIDTKGILFTNIDLSHADECTADFVNNTPGASAYLNINFQLIGPKSVTPNQIFECGVRVIEDLDAKLATDVTGDFVVECVDGYAPHKRVHVENGVGKFQACALMLQPGETMRIKIGTKTYSSRAEIIIPVVQDDSSK